jgi:protein-S-isoprenylcysteine O-methyltransferase Ste14
MPIAPSDFPPYIIIMENEKTIPNGSHAQLKKKVAIRFGLAGPVLAAMFFLPAGTWNYWQAWIYLAILLVPMFMVVAYFLKKDPELMERRMRMKEKEREQKAIIILSYPFFLAAFLLPGFDRRFGWSAVPLWVVIAADVIVLIAYGLFFRVMRENRFLSRVVEVEQTQKVISTGPYALVRHPMYAAVIPMYFFSPLALGSLWALIPAAFVPLILIARIFNEEKVLGKDLAGYTEYTRKVKYRLIPGIW